VPYLAVDTSAGLAVVVVGDEGDVLARTVETEPRRHVEQLVPHIDQALAQAAVAAGDLSAVIVGTGPAPFTGLRVGLVTARTLGYALGVPVLGVPSLAAVALRALDLCDLTDDPAREVVVVTDARRREVYWARYRRDPALGVRAVVGPQVGSPDQVEADGAALAGRAVPLLIAAGRAEPVGALATELVDLDPDPAALVALALARQAHGEPNPVEPLYLRRPDAVPSVAVHRVGI